MANARRPSAVQRAHALSLSSSIGRSEVVAVVIMSGYQVVVIVCILEPDALRMYRCLLPGCLVEALLYVDFSKRMQI